MKAKQQTSNDYTSIKRTYRCTECLGCPFQKTCAKRKRNKIISVSVKNQKQRKEVRERLHTKEGKELYGKRKQRWNPYLVILNTIVSSNVFPYEPFQKSTGMGSYLCCP